MGALWHDIRLALTSVAALTMVSGLGANVTERRRQSENPTWQAAADEEKRGREMLARVITAMGCA